MTADGIETECDLDDCSIYGNESQNQSPLQLKENTTTNN